MRLPNIRFTVCAVLLVLGSDHAAAQSHPAWWTYASPEATALVGIQWNNLRSSPLAAAVSSGLRPGGSLRFPNVPMLGSADQILVSSPALLAMEYGVFPADVLAQQARASDMRLSSYRGVAMFVSRDPEVLSIARIDDNLLLLGFVETLEDAIERGQYRIAVREAEPGTELDPEETPTSAQRAYTPLLAKAAKYSREDLWAVSSKFPDPLASLFVPLTVEADAFEGSVSLWDGMHLVAGITAGSVPKAVDIMDYMRTSVSGVRPMARALEVSVEQTTVLVRMDLNQADFTATLQQGDATPPTTVGQTAPAAPPSATGQSAQPSRSPAQSPTANPASAAPAAPVVPERRVVRIIGLENQPKEIELPPNQR